MLWSSAAEKGGIDGELVGWGGLAARKTLSQQINEGNTKLADFLTQNDDHDDGDIGDSLNMFCFVLMIKFNLDMIWWYCWDRGDDLWERRAESRGIILLSC